jgi:hypothetical protein
MIILAQLLSGHFFFGGNAGFLKEEEKGLVGREEQKRAKFKRHCRQ